MTLIEKAAKGFPDAATLMELAIAKTGLDDFDLPRLQAPLDALVYSFQRDAWPRMIPAAREMAVVLLVDHLAARLRLIDDRKRYAEIAQVQIRKPLIIVGPPRSGSSMLHTLLSLDPENIGPPYWLCMEPSPPPALGEPSAARLAETGERTRRFMDQIPNIYVQHSQLVEEGASALGECGSEVMVMNMTSKGLVYFYPLYSYRDYLLKADHSGALGFHHDFLQHAGWGREDKRWVLKGADHMLWLKELHAQYPDAGLIWTHRDLAQLLGSTSSVLATTRGVCGPVPDAARRDIAREAVELERLAFEKGLRSRSEIGEAPFYDSSYHDVMADPVRSIERIYERFGLHLSGAAADNIRAWVAANPQTKHGVHAHKPEDFGLDADAINAQFSDYRERFGFGFGIRQPLLA